MTGLFHFVAATMPRVFALSTALRDFTRDESPPSVDVFARESLDQGAAGVTIAAGVPEKRFAEMAAIFRGAACPVLAIEAPNPRPPGFEKNPALFSDLAPSAVEPQERLAAERALKRTIEVAADREVSRVLLRLGRVMLPPGMKTLAENLEGEEIGSPRAAGWARDGISARSACADPHFDAVRRTLEAALPTAERHGIRVFVTMPRFLEELPSFRELDAILGELDGAPLGLWIDPAAAFTLDKLGL